MARITAAFALFALVSCAEGEPETTPPIAEYGELTVAIDTPYDNLTRALTTQHEYEVKTVEVLVFDRTPAANFVMMAATDQITEPTGSIRRKEFSVKLPLGNHDVVILANSAKWIEDNFTTTAEGIIPPASEGTVLKLDDIKQALKAEVVAGEGWNADPADLPAYKAIPMIGSASNVTVHPNESNTIGTVTLYRTIAKVDVELDAAVTNFELYSVRVYNYNTDGYLFRGMYNSVGATLTTAPHNTVLRYTIPAAEPDKTKITDEMYLFEFDNQFDTIVNPNVRDKRVCLVVGGYYDTENYLSYYRLDFRIPNDPYDPTKGWNYLDVMRNTHFKFEITEVKESGWPDEEVAFRGEYKDIMVEIISWENMNFPNTPL